MMRVWLAAAIAVSPGPAAAQEAVRWLQTAAHRLAAPEPTAAELAPIVSRLSGARIIGVGEVTHGSGSAA